MINGCTPRVKYIVPNIEIKIPDKPELYTDIAPPVYDKKKDQIIYNRVDASKLYANIVKLQADAESVRIRLMGVKKALEHLKKKELENK